MGWAPTAMLPGLPICKSLKLCASLLLVEKSCLFKDPKKFKRCILPVTQLQTNGFDDGSRNVIRNATVHQTWSILQVGKLQEGIICSAWSPDQEFLAICTGTRQLVLMNKVVPVCVLLRAITIDALP